MTLWNFKVCEPRYSRNTYHPISMVTRSCNIFIFAVKMACSTFETITQPQLVFFYEREYFFIMYCILMSHNHKLLLILHQLCHILPKQ